MYIVTTKHRLFMNQKMEEQICHHYVISQYVSFVEKSELRERRGHLREERPTLHLLYKGNVQHHQLENMLPDGKEHKN